MKIAICDDQIELVNTTKEYLLLYAKNNGVDIDIYTFTSAQQVLSSNVKFNIAVLDVEMPDMDGLTLGKMLRQDNENIVLIFLTAHTKYLDDALNLNAARFFEKPVDMNRFFRGIDDAIKRIDNTTVNIFVKHGFECLRVNACDIVFIEIRRGGVRIVTKNNEYHSNRNIHYWEERLASSCFAKPHNSYIINLNYLTKYGNNSITLLDKYEIALSRNFKKEFNAKFIAFMED